FDKQIQLTMGQANVKRWAGDILPLLGNDDPLGVESFHSHQIPIEDGESGVLLDDPQDLAAYGKAVAELLDDPDRAERIGEKARERVLARFLGSHSQLNYLKLLEPHTRPKATDPAGT
ncbi:MAG: hypothetical protein QOE05_3356, partial [Actinomycetota bacterium]|nr:hypothetical protein [Actinomycetota bacterium]